MFRKVRSLTQSFRNMLGFGGQVSVADKDLCLFPDVQLSVRFKMPKFDVYDGHEYLVAHLRGFCSKMRGAGRKDEILMAYFSQSLSGSALEWYTHQDHNRWYTWDDLAQAFARHFQYNIEIVLDRLSLTKIEKKPSENFREYGFHWIEQAARVNPSMEESKMVEYFLQALEPTYFGHLILAIGKSFNKVVKMGGMVEEGLKSSKIMSYSAIKATTQAIQNNTGGVIRRRRKKMWQQLIQDHGLDLGAHHTNIPNLDPIIEPTPKPHITHPNTTSHYQTLLFLSTTPKHTLNLLPTHNSMPQPHKNTYPAPQNAYPPPRAYRNPAGPGFQPNPAFKNERVQQKKTFTPLGESYTSLFHRLRQLDMLRPIESKLPNPPPKNLYYSVSCEYCSGTPAHNTEKCWHLKNAIQELIYTNRIEVQTLEAPNINQNPLPAHQETNMIEIVHKGGEPKKPSQTVMIIRSSEVKPVKQPTVEGSVNKLSKANDKPSVVIKEGPPSDVTAKQEKSKMVVPGAANKPIIIVEGAVRILSSSSL
ncbi:uncharacterized protein [Nicotiana sylvestris]|uniref:uncharacterized protein n=1 Tax=Nicotiana sylvestris TaxID=4096 RepID=UPI00388C77D4